MTRSSKTTKSASKQCAVLGYSKKAKRRLWQELRKQERKTEFLKQQLRKQLMLEMKVKKTPKPVFGPKLEQKAEAKLEPKLEPRIEPKIEGKAERKVEREAEAKFKAKAEAKAGTTRIEPSPVSTKELLPRFVKAIAYSFSKDEMVVPDKKTNRICGIRFRRVLFEPNCQATLLPFPLTKGRDRIQSYLMERFGTEEYAWSIVPPEQKESDDLLCKAPTLKIVPAKSDSSIGSMNLGFAQPIQLDCLSFYLGRRAATLLLEESHSTKLQDHDKSILKEYLNDLATGKKSWKQIVPHMRRGDELRDVYVGRDFLDTVHSIRCGNLMVMVDKEYDYYGNDAKGGSDTANNNIRQLLSIRCKQGIDYRLLLTTKKHFQKEGATVQDDLSLVRAIPGCYPNEENLFHIDLTQELAVCKDEEGSSRKKRPCWDKRRDQWKKRSKTSDDITVNGDASLLLQFKQQPSPATNDPAKNLVEKELQQDQQQPNSSVLLPLTDKLPIEEKSENEKEEEEEEEEVKSPHQQHHDEEY